MLSKPTFSYMTHFSTVTHSLSSTWSLLPKTKLHRACIMDKEPYEDKNEDPSKFYGDKNHKHRVLDRVGALAPPYPLIPPIYAVFFSEAIVYIPGVSDLRRSTNAPRKTYNHMTNFEKRSPDAPVKCDICMTKVRKGDTNLNSLLLSDQLKQQRRKNKMRYRIYYFTNMYNSECPQ
jgi:hypothetical protein